MGNNNIKNIRIDSLTSLRFLAIMIVVVHHLRDLVGWGPKTGWGAVGVTFFFVLSGFVLSINYKNIVSCKDAISFLWRRFARLYPLYFLTFIVSFFVIHFYNINLDTGIVSSLANLFLLQSWFSSSQIHFAYNSASWAISTLVFFYIVFILIQFDSPRNILVIISVSLLSLIFSVCYILINNCEPLQIHWLIHMVPTNRIVVFLFGILLAKLFLSKVNRFKKINFLTASFFEVVLLVLIIDRLSTCSVLNILVQSVNSVIDAPLLLSRQLIDIYFLSPVLCGLLIFVCSLEHGIISRILVAKPLIFLGELSFAIYLSHQLIFRILSRIKVDNEANLILLAFIITIFISYFLYRYVEKPCSNYLKRIGSNWAL